jgi:CubicO group peptidase (beta-lactamase class C family)
MTRRRLVAAPLLLALPAFVLAQPAHVPDATAVAAMIERELRAANVPGASFAIVAGNRTLTGRVGLADAERSVIMTPATLMQVGSLNKLMTALALTATLDEQGIPFDIPVGKHVTGLSPRLAQVTFHQLLTHTSGLRDAPGGGGTADERALAARVRAITDADFLLPPGTVFSYSNLGYAVAGFALEQLRQRPFADALDDALLKPLLMRTSTMRLSVASRRQHAVGHRSAQSGPVAIRDFDNDTSLWPSGYLWTTADELQTLLRLLAHGGDNPFGIPQRVFTRAWSAHASMPNVFVGGHYGYGLMIASERGTRIYEHGGTQRGFSSVLRVAPDHRFGLVILANLDNAPLRRITQTVMAEALGLPPPLTPTRTELPVTAERFQPLAGVYRNRGTAEIAVREGRVVLVVDNGPPMPVTQIGEHRYLARPKPDIAGPEFVLQPATAAAPTYLHFALWAFTR